MNGSAIANYVYKKSEPLGAIDVHFLEVAVALLDRSLELSHCPIEQSAA